MDMPKHKWASAHDWLHQKGDKADFQVLFSMFSQVIYKLDSDEIQDLFQNEMDEDGYFVDLEDWAKTDDELLWVRQRGTEMLWQVIHVVYVSEELPGIIPRYYVKDIGVDLNDYSNIGLHSMVDDLTDEDDGFHQAAAQAIAKSEAYDQEDDQCETVEELAAHLKEKYGIYADPKDLEV
jgi:hypothetical protein